MRPFFPRQKLKQYLEPRNRGLSWRKSGAHNVPCFLLVRAGRGISALLQQAKHFEWRLLCQQPLGLVL